MKTKGIAVVLAIFLGGFGVHKFYLNRKSSGILYLIFFWTLIPSLLAFIDFIIMLCMNDEKFDRIYNGQ